MKGKYTFADLTVPRHKTGLQPVERGTVLCEVLVNDYWVVDAKTGEQCLYKAPDGRYVPQANQNPGIMNTLVSKAPDGFVAHYGREVEVRQVPIAFVPRSHRDL